MNSLKKINTYLLERYPLLWHSKSIQLTISGLLFWLISFLFGYLYIDLDILKQQNITRVYSKSSFVFFHVIICIIILSIWAISFYKNNAFKNLYPLKKGYFTKLFTLLFIPLFILSSSYIPFMKGVNLKVQSLYTPKEIKKEINTINLASVFLINNTANYYISNRSYPSPYPLESTFFNNSTGKWGDNHLYVYDEFENNMEYNPINFDSLKSIKVGESKFQFYKTKTIFRDENECNPLLVIDKFYDKDDLDNPELYSILNYSKVLVSGSNFLPKDSSDIRYKERYAPFIYKVVQEKKTNEIRKTIDEFKRICSKYKIDYVLNTEHITKYLEIKEFKNFESITNRYYDVSSRGIYGSRNEITEIQNSIKNEIKFLDLMEDNETYFYNEDQLSTTFSNFGKVEKWKNSFLKLEIFILFCFISLSLAWLFIFFEFTSIKSFIISIPIVGVLLIINVLITSFLNGSSTIIFLVSFLTTSSLILFLTYLGLYHSIFSKKITNILFNLSYIALPFLLIMIILIYNELTRKYSYIDKCSSGISYRYEDSFLMNPIFFFISSLIGILFFFLFLKRWKSLEE